MNVYALALTIIQTTDPATEIHQKAVAVLEGLLDKALKEAQGGPKLATLSDLVVG